MICCICDRKDTGREGKRDMMSLVSLAEQIGAKRLPSAYPYLWGPIVDMRSVKAEDLEAFTSISEDSYAVVIECEKLFVTLFKDHGQEQLLRELGLI